MALTVLRSLNVLALLHTALSLSISSSPQVWALLGSPALLPCSFDPPGNVGEQLEGLGLSWSWEGGVLASFGLDGNVSTPGVKLPEETDLRGGNASLTLFNTSISQQGEYHCTVSYNTSESETTNTTLYILAPPTVRVLRPLVSIGRESVVECEAEGFFPPPIQFSWLRDDIVERILEAMPANHSADGSYRALSQLHLIPQPDDAGHNYSCLVNHSALASPLREDFTLIFTRRPVVSVSSASVSSGEPQTLYCHVSDFFPEEITIRWLHNGTLMANGDPTAPRPHGTFSTTRYLTLSPAQREAVGEVQCQVTQPGFEPPASDTIVLSVPDTGGAKAEMSKAAKAAVALMIISLVLVILLGFGFSWRKRDEKLKGLSVSGIILPTKMVVGRKAVLTCCVEGRLVDRVHAAWFVNDKPIPAYSPASEELPSAALSSQDLEAPLLPPASGRGYYRLKTQRPLQSSRRKEQQLLSHLCFRPDLRLHRGALFKCQVSYQGKEKVVEERVSDRVTLLAAPSVSEIRVVHSDCEGDVVSGTSRVHLEVEASRFHPGLVTFRWFCEGGELSPAQPAAEPLPDTEGYFRAVSQCKVPVEELRRPGFKVWVTVHHMALKEPITRESRGLVKRPEVSDISCSPGQPLTLGCQIAGFYPSDLAVSWLRKRGEDEEELEGVVSLWGPMQTDPHTYRASAQAVLTEKGSEGGREEIVCRVEHSSLPEPIERQWTHVSTAPPSIPDAVEVRREAGVYVFSLVLRGGSSGGAVHWAAGRGGALRTTGAEAREGAAGGGGYELHSCCTVERRTDGRRRAGDRGTDGEASRDPDTHSQRKANGATQQTNGAVVNVHCHDDAERSSDSELTVEIGTTVGERREEEGGEKGGEGQTDKGVAKTISCGGVREGGERLTVLAEITHPALALPVYRSWTGNTDF